MVLVLLIKKQDLKHHLDARRLIQVEVELLKYLEFCFHKHFGDELDVALFFAKLGGLLKVEYAIFVHLYRKTKAHDGDQGVHWRHDQTLIHEKEPIIQLDGVHGGDVIKTVKILDLENPMEHVDAIFTVDSHFVGDIVFDFLIGASFVGAHVCRLLYYLGIFTKLKTIGINVVSQGLLGVFAASLEAKLDPAKKLSIDSEFFADLLVELLLT